MKFAIFLRQVFFVVVFFIFCTQHAYCDIKALAARMYIEEYGWFTSVSGANLYKSGVTAYRYYVGEAVYCISNGKPAIWFYIYKRQVSTGEVVPFASGYLYANGGLFDADGLLIGVTWKGGSYGSSGCLWNPVKDKEGNIIGYIDSCDNNFYDPEGNPSELPLIYSPDMYPCFVDSDGTPLLYLNVVNGNFYDSQGNPVNYPTYGMLTANDSLVGYIGSDNSFVDLNGVYYPPGTWSFEGNLGVTPFIDGIALFNQFNDVIGFLGKSLVDGKYEFQSYSFPGPIVVNNDVFYSDKPRPNQGTVAHPDPKDYPTIPPEPVTINSTFVPNYGSGGGGSGGSGSGGSGSGGGGSGGGGSDGGGSDGGTIILPWAPDPDPDDSNPPDNPDPPDTPEPPTPPDPGVGGTVNQYNEITQNNDYTVTNNDNRSYDYNYNFDDSGSNYSADGMFSDLSLSVTIPGRINQRASQLMSSVSSALGIERIKSVMQVTQGSLGEFCIDITSLNIGNVNVLPIKTCVNLDELAASSHMQLLRNVLLFMVIFMFISSVFVVLRQY
jgi:uncharacterized membrane protein YgcG